jgi:hypothetical protein
VDRLLRLAEESALAGDSERTESLLAVLSPAIYLRNQEIRDMRKMAKITEAQAK